MTEAPSSIRSGRGGSRWHERCSGVYGGHPCDCDCHSEPASVAQAVTAAGCSRCGDRSVPPGDAAHEERCAAEHTARNDVVELGLRCGVPEHLTTDLWAHLRSGPDAVAMTPEAATRTTRFLLYMGWRPPGHQQRPSAENPG